MSRTNGSNASAATVRESFSAGKMGSRDWIIALSAMECNKSRSGSNRRAVTAVGLAENRRQRFDDADAEWLDFVNANTAVK